MGSVPAACQCCAEKPRKSLPTPVPSESADAQKNSGRSRPNSSRNRARPAAHEGQRRANLEVKDGGFTLKNFTSTNPGRLEDFYNVNSKTVGEGAFGVVRTALDRKTKMPRAVKRIMKTDAKEVEKMKEEIEIIRLLDHPNIVRFFESFQDRKSITLIMELCEGGELFDRIVKAGNFTESVACQCVKQMFQAINYLHQNLIIHRDLKPENWLIAKLDPVEVPTLKLIDFGISKRLRPGDTASSKVGTPNYVAPEVFQGRYNEKVDVWSTGIIMYIMLSGNQPFPGRAVTEILEAVRRANIKMEGTPWRKISSGAKGLIKALLQKTPSVRPSCIQALQHQWFTGQPDAEDVECFLSKLEVNQLKAFSQFNKVKKAALTVVASQLSDSRIENLKNMFMGLDSNADGTLSVAELKQGLKLGGVRIPKDLARVLEEVDTDGSGVLDYTEFLAATMDKKLYSQEAIVWAAFRRFDVDGNGTIDAKELTRVLGDEELKEELSIASDSSQLADLFAQIDLNGDGVVDFDEFFAMVRAKEDDVRDTKPPASGRSEKSPRMSGRKNSGKKSPRPSSGRSGTRKASLNIGIAGGEKEMSR